MSRIEIYGDESGDVSRSGNPGALAEALDDVVRQLHSGPTQSQVVAAATDVSVQAADYCGWAIQRKWERGDFRAHSIVGSLIASDHLLFEG